MNLACSINVMRLRLKRDDITSENVLEFVPVYTALMGWPADARLRISQLDGSVLYCTASGELLKPPPARSSVTPARSSVTPAPVLLSKTEIPGRKEACEACDQFDRQKQKCPYCGCGTRRLWRSPGLPCPHPTNPRWVMP